MWSHRLAVRTLASHAGNRGSIPRGITTNYKGFQSFLRAFFIGGHKIRTQKTNPAKFL